MAYAILKDKENNFYYQVVVDGNQTHFITPEFVKRFSSKEKAFDEMLFFIANKSFEALKNNGDKDIYIRDADIWRDRIFDRHDIKSYTLLCKNRRRLLKDLGMRSQARADSDRRLFH